MCSANKADVNAKTSVSQTPLTLAALFGYKEIVSNLLFYGADVNINNNTGDSTALHNASRNPGPVSIASFALDVKSLTEKGAKVSWDSLSVGLSSRIGMKGRKCGTNKLS